LANPELGTKQLCPNCQAKFYDLSKRPAHCPKCDTEFDPDEAVRSRRTRIRAVAPEPEEEREDLVAKREVEDADEEEDDEGVTPALDAAVDEPVLVEDEDEDADPVAPAPVEDPLAGFSEDEEALEDDADVPFLEDDDEDEFDDSEIEGLPGEGEER
jgi:uncharacterized protein (TIGR02300 family)